MKERQRWQPEEDSLLRAYVKQFGPKEWNLISVRMGKPLDRDPKSCLERWKNYLKPGIKKGSLTPEEQTLVISLQEKYGNKWKKIAAEVPGRTAKRLGKWWEVFKEKQSKQKSGRVIHQDPTVVGSGYDHILETFAEKYVQPAYGSCSGSVPDPHPILSLGPDLGTNLLPWMINLNSTTSSLSSSSSTPTVSPSVSLTLSPAEPVLQDPDVGNPTRFFPSQQMGNLVMYCKELEEGKESWLRHNREATWRLNRQEQQLEVEKARRMKEKIEFFEAQVSRLREEEMVFVSKMEGEYREQLNALHRDAEGKEAKLMEVWHSKHEKLRKMIQQIGAHSSGQ